MKYSMIFLLSFFFLNCFSQNSGLNFNQDERNYIIAPHSATFYPVNNFTIEFTFKINPDAKGTLSLLNKSQCVTNKFSWGIGLSEDSLLYITFDCDGNCTTTTAYTCNTFINKGQCYHVAVTYSSTDVNFYIDGILQSGSYTSGTGPCGNLYLTNEPMKIGVYRYKADTLGSFFDGIFDEVRIWNHVRTAAQISDFYEQKLTGSETGLLLFYDFNDNITGNGVTVQNKASFTGTVLDGTSYSQTSTTPNTVNSCFNYASIDESASENSSLFIYPNPTDRYINIKHNNNSTGELFNISIFDVSGREIFNETTTLPAKIDMSGFEKGMYVVKTSGETSAGCAEISLY